MSNIVNKIEPAVSEIVSEIGYELYDMELVVEGTSTILRVYIESLTENKIMIEDCIKANSVITKYLDQEDPITDAYMLEVSSPGIIRKLKKVEHYKKEINKEISIKTRNKVESFESKKHVGKLEAVNEEGIIIDGESIPFSEITKAETTFKF